MKDSMQCILNAIGLSDYAQMQLYRGMNAMELLVDRLQTLAVEIFVIVDTAPPAVERVARAYRHVTIVRHENGDLASLCTRLTAVVSADFFIYVRADAPFVDLACLQRMIDIHRTYAAEFTFADGYPGGFTAEILNSELLPALARLAHDGECLTIATTLFAIIERDINAFDIETELATRDLRSLRIELYCDSKNNYLLCRALAEKSDRGKRDLLATVEAEPQLLRQLPMFIAFELTARRAQTPLYLPHQLLDARPISSTHEMSVDLLQMLLDQICSYSPQAMVYFSLWGEIALHSQLESILRMSDAFPMPFVCETSGIGWHDRHLTLLEQHAKNMTFIVALDSHDAAVYRRVRGAGFDEATRYAQRLLALCPERTYIQATRMRENEDSLEGFYRHWQKQTDRVIIQKYDHYSKQLAERKVVDISPLTRLPCWHNKRDIVVHVDGTVPLCREDVGREHILGSVQSDSVEQVWERGQAYYDLHIKNEYPALCAECDEYYTYNH